MRRQRAVRGGGPEEIFGLEPGIASSLVLRISNIEVCYGTCKHDFTYSRIHTASSLSTHVEEPGQVMLPGPSSVSECAYLPRWVKPWLQGGWSKDSQA
ncbi:hypothetical protein TRIATDRAFT_299825 [Trichoderma atroviride IMI 206040]|uniref:Uncharacterized protein n=1 Tax=Hypocrea atroviridis (strain ATCC 20476 / IMI 206040) TaxID=452589 RepID=G9NVR5_HYPAI|nr:uncharacterized protein TRIATDRAFT_299825 [Trichoderma atroviride IMI 206040]EHK45083.1 hypothetical protein TRIATDRAFT_299825 [Trichoderma atroviride IMI 206040]